MEKLHREAEYKPDETVINLENHSESDPWVPREDYVQEQDIPVIQPPNFIYSNQISTLPISKGKVFDINLYATKKSAANGLLDIALLMANAAQLKHILISDSHPFYALMLSLLLTSILLQIILGVGLLVQARTRIITDNPDRFDEKRLRVADRLNNWVVAGVFVLTVVNVFISAFGLNDNTKSVNSDSRRGSG